MEHSNKVYRHGIRLFVLDRQGGSTSAPRVIRLFPTTKPMNTLFFFRCGRDFTKLVERIADQKRFEEEQRAARAAERLSGGKLSPEAVAGDGGDSSAAESSSRKPKGLVWEVCSMVGKLRAE